MARRLLKALFDFSGGLNTDAAPDNFAANELMELTNGILDTRGSVAKRKGFQRLNAENYGAQVEQLIHFPRKDGSSELLAVIGTTLAKINDEDGTKTDLQELARSFIGYAIFNDKFWFTDGVEYRKYDGEKVVNAQLPAPGTAPTLTAVAGETNLGAGTYKGVVTFEDEDGGESPASPEATVTLAEDGQQIEWGNIPIGPEGTKKRVLYRTLKDGETFRKVAEIDDNETTAYTDKISDAALGVHLKSDNMLDRIRRCRFMLWHPRSYRFFAAGDSEDRPALYYSEREDPTYFKEVSRLHPATAEGPVTGLFLFGETVVVFYERGAYAWRGIDAAVDATWEKIPVPEGTLSPQAIVATPSSLTYLGNASLNAIGPSVAGTQVTLGDQQQISMSLSRNKVGSLIRKIAHKQVAAAVYDSDNELFLLAYASDTLVPRNNEILVYHWPLGAFARWTGVQVNTWLWQRTGRLLAGSDGYILVAHQGYNDFGNPISFAMETAPSSFGYDLVKKKLYNFYYIGGQFSGDQATVPKVVLTGEYESVEAVLGAIDESFIWGREWGLVWGYTDYVVKRCKLFLKGLRFRVRVEDAFLDQPILIHGFGLDFRPLGHLASEPKGGTT